MAIRNKLFSLLVGGATVATLFITGATGAAASDKATCAGGTIAPGTYSSLTITGFCSRPMAGSPRRAGEIMVGGTSPRYVNIC